MLIRRGKKPEGFEIQNCKEGKRRNLHQRHGLRWCFGCNSKWQCPRGSGGSFSITYFHPTHRLLVHFSRRGARLEKVRNTKRRKGMTRRHFVLSLFVRRRDVEQATMMMERAGKLFDLSPPLSLSLSLSCALEVRRKTNVLSSSIPFQVCSLRFERNLFRCEISSRVRDYNNNDVGCTLAPIRKRCK